MPRIFKRWGMQTSQSLGLIKLGLKVGCWVLINLRALILYVRMMRIEVIEDEVQARH